MTNALMDLLIAAFPGDSQKGAWWNMPSVAPSLQGHFSWQNSNRLQCSFSLTLPPSSAPAPDIPQHSMHLLPEATLDMTAEEPNSFSLQLITDGAPLPNITAQDNPILHRLPADISPEISELCTSTQAPPTLVWKKAYGRTFAPVLKVYKKSQKKKDTENSLCMHKGILKHTSNVS